MADKLGADSTSGGSKPNFTDDQRQIAIRELVPLKNALEEASGVYRACLKRWKSLGANTKALTTIISERRQDPAAIMAQVREEVRIRAISGRFPTIQTDLMGMFETAGQDITDKTQSEMDEFRVQDEGYFAGYEGHMIETCPAAYAPGSPFHAAWHRGWHTGQAALATKTLARGQVEAGKKKNGANRGTTTATPRKRGRPKKGEQPAATA